MHARANRGTARAIRAVTSHRIQQYKNRINNGIQGGERETTVARATTTILEACNRLHAPMMMVNVTNMSILDKSKRNQTR